MDAFIVKNTRTGSVFFPLAEVNEAAQQWQRPCTEHGVHNSLMRKPPKMLVYRPLAVTVWCL